MKKMLFFILASVFFFLPQQAYAQTCPVTPTSNNSVTTTVTISQTGTYKVWSRVLVPDTINNSYYLQIDGGCAIAVGDATTTPVNTWAWVDYQDGSTTNAILLSLTAGDHTVKLIEREGGIGIDRLVFTQDTTCIPNDMGDNCPTATSTPVVVSNTPVPTIIPTATPVPTVTPTPTIQPTSTPTPPLLNLIQNNSFESTATNWLSPWTFTVQSGARATISHDATTKAAGAYSAKVAITRSNTPWYVQLAQGNVPMSAGKTYTISFWAKASNSRNIQVVMQQNYTPYTTYYSKSVAINGSWKAYTLTFTPTKTDNNLLFTFNLAQQTGTVWIDNVSIK